MKTAQRISEAFMATGLTIVEEESGSPHESNLPSPQSIEVDPEKVNPQKQPDITESRGLDVITLRNQIADIQSDYGEVAGQVPPEVLRRLESLQQQLRNMETMDEIRESAYEFTNIEDEELRATDTENLRVESRSPLNESAIVHGALAAAGLGGLSDVAGGAIDHIKSKAHGAAGKVGRKISAATRKKISDGVKKAAKKLGIHESNAIDLFTEEMVGILESVQPTTSQLIAEAAAVVHHQHEEVDRPDADITDGMAEDHLDNILQKPTKLDTVDAEDHDLSSYLDKD